MNYIETVAFVNKEIPYPEIRNVILPLVETGKFASTEEYIGYVDENQVCITMNLGTYMGTIKLDKGELVLTLLTKFNFKDIVK